MAMVEMVFVLPVLLLTVFAIAEFGLMFNRWLTLSNAVREGARAGVVFRQSCSAGDVDTAVTDAVTRYASAGGITSGLQIKEISGQCVDGNPLVVRAEYPFTLNIPFATNATVPLSYTAVMRNEG